MTDYQPLGDDELAQLDSFLLSDACDEETLGIDEAHGLLTALHLIPEEVDEASWLDAIWGEPSFADPAQQAQMSELLRRMRAEILAILDTRSEFEPLVIELDEEGETVEAWEGWCQGFVMGMELFPLHWEALPKDEQALVVPMAQLALLASDDEMEMDDQEYQDWLELIPGAVMGLYAYWHVDR